MSRRMVVSITARASEERGFSLMQLSLLLAVGALLVMAGIAGGDKRVMGYKDRQFRETITAIEDATRGFMIKHGRRPCPADLRLASDNASFGKEDGAAGNCNDGNLGVITHVIAGGVPTAALELEKRYAFDPWNRRILYIVDRRATAKGRSTGECSSPDFVQGNVTIYDGIGLYLRQVKAFYVSHGADGHGAVPYDGVADMASRINTGSADGASQINAGVDASFNPQFGAGFFEMDKTDAYDDLTGSLPSTENVCCIGASCVS